MTRLVVIGGGIAGLAAAWEARGHEVTVLEASPTFGGKIRTSSFGGMPVEEGPDVFLARVPWGTQLATEVGLADQLVSPDTSSAAIHCRGRLRPIPDGLVLGVPTDLGALARSGALSARGVVRAGLDLVLPRRRRTAIGDDPTVAEVIGGRFGREVLEHLVAPLLGGINAGDVDRLSLRAVAPNLADAANAHRSLLLALRHGATTRGGVATAADGPLFHSVAGGLQTLPDTVTARLRAAGVELRPSCPVATVEPASSGLGVRVGLADGATIDADGVVIATPAPAMAAVLSDAAPDVSELARGVDHASVSLLAVAFPRSVFATPPVGSGFLVPRTLGRLMTACTHYSTKWSTEAGDEVVMRISSGRFGDTRHLDLDDETLTERLLGDLADLTGVSAPPTAVRVTRWIDGFPQYEPGHAARIAELEQRLAARLPAVQVAGAAISGVGIPACIRSGRQAARALVDGDADG